VKTGNAVQWEETNNKTVLLGESLLMVDSFEDRFFPSHIVSFACPPLLKVMSYNVRYDNPDDKHQWKDRKQAMATIIHAR
jgi:hypothetical protein